MEIGTVKPIAIEDEMKSSYLDYAMSVIVSRALPDVRDGLKPVHRRILVTLHDLSLTHTAHYRKSAKICGDVSGNYHPHGEAVVYPSMARLAQDFNMRYPLVDGQGNFGSIDGDNPAAMRYTEARMTAIAEEMLADIDKDTVNWVENYDSTRKEPSVLPARIPSLLINGSSGIAVGMATNIPPHNLGEVCNAAIHIINRHGACVEAGIPFDVMWARAHTANLAPEVIQHALYRPAPALREQLAAKAVALGHRGKGLDADTLTALTDDMVEIAPEELIDFVKGPDFPTGGLILGMEGIQSAYTTGRGRIVVRAKAFIEDMRANRFQIVVTELPYQVNKSSLIEKIADLVRDKRIEGISDLRDESDRQGMRIVIELRRDATPRQVLNQLYKHTAMQSSFSANMLALVDNQPRTLSLKAALQHFIDHRREVVTRRTKFDLEKALQRAHILEGLKIALDNLDEIINIIRRSRDADTARPTLMRRFGLSEVQAQAILDLQLRRLAALERKKILDELAEIKKRIAYLEDLLATPLKILYLIRDELEAIKTKYGDPRRTRVLGDASSEISEEDLIPDQEVVVGLTARGYVRRLPVEAYRPQRKARGAGTGAIITREDDAVIHLMIANTRDDVLFFTDRGRVYQMKVNDIPDAAAARQSRGLPLANFVSLDPRESVTALVRVREYKQGQYLVMLTRLGEIKRIDITDFASVRTTGIIAIDLAEGDELRLVRRTEGNDDIILASNNGHCIRFSEKAVRASGRTAGGVRGIKLGADDETVGLDVVGRGADLLSVSERGFVKRTAVEEFAPQGRGGGGLVCMKTTPKTGKMVAVRIASVADEVMIASHDGMIYRSNVKRIPRLGRSTMGIGLVKISAKDRVVAMACLYAAGAQQPPDDEGPEEPKRVRTEEAVVAAGDGKAASDGKKAIAKQVVKVAPDGGTPEAKATPPGKKSTTGAPEKKATATATEKGSGTAKPAPSAAAPKTTTGGKSASKPAGPAAAPDSKPSTRVKRRRQ